MSKRVLIVTGLVLVLLVALATPTVAASPNSDSTASSQMMSWSVLKVYGFGFSGIVQPNGDCETAGNCGGG